MVWASELRQAITDREGVEAKTSVRPQVRSLDRRREWGIYRVAKSPHPLQSSANIQEAEMSLLLPPLRANNQLQCIFYRAGGFVLPRVELKSLDRVHSVLL